MEIVQQIIANCRKYGPDEYVDISDLFGIDKSRAVELTDLCIDVHRTVDTFTELLAEIVNHVDNVNELCYVCYLFGRFVERYGKKEVISYGCGGND